MAKRTKEPLRPRRSGSARKAAAATSPAQTRVPAATAIDRGGRLRILEAAIRSFADVGYEGTTTARVARDAGVTQPLVHHHFGSKEGMWRAAMDHLFAGVNDFVPSGNDPKPVLALAAVLEQFVRFVAVRPEVTRVITREGAVASSRLSLLIDLYLRAPFQRVIDLVRAGQAGGAIRSDVRPELFLFFMLGAGSHLFDVAALARESAAVDVDAEAVREEFVDLARSVLIDGLLWRG